MKIFLHYSLLFSANTHTILSDNRNNKIKEEKMSYEEEDVEFLLSLFIAKTMEMVNRTPKNDSTINLKDNKSFKYLSQNIMQVMLNKTIKEASNFVLSVIPEEDKRNFIFSAYGCSATKSGIFESEGEKTGRCHTFASDFSIKFSAFAIEERICVEDTREGESIRIFVPEEVIKSGMRYLGDFVKTLGAVISYSTRYGMRSALCISGSDCDDLEFVHEINVEKVEERKRIAIEKMRLAKENNLKKDQDLVKDNDQENLNKVL